MELKKIKRVNRSLCSMIWHRPAFGQGFVVSTAECCAVLGSRFCISLRHFCCRLWLRNCSLFSGFFGAPSFCRLAFTRGFICLLWLFLAFLGSPFLCNSYAAPPPPYPYARLSPGWSGLLGFVLDVAETMGKVRPPATSMIIISAPTPKDDFTRAFIDALRIRGFAIWEEEKSLLGRKKPQIPSGINAFRLNWTLEGIKGSSFIRLTLRYEKEVLTRVFFRSKEGKIKDTGPWTRRTAGQ